RSLCECDSWHLAVEDIGASHFFFSSRRRHTRSKRDWSSDVCSSDLRWGQNAIRSDGSLICCSDVGSPQLKPTTWGSMHTHVSSRSEERRVGKECRFKGEQDS